MSPETTLNQLVAEYCDAPMSDDSSLSLGWALTLRAAQDGAVVFWKVDGERSERIMTVVAFGGPLGDLTIRRDTNELAEGLAAVFSEYAQLVWASNPPPSGSRT